MPLILNILLVSIVFAAVLIFIACITYSIRNKKYNFLTFGYVLFEFTKFNKREKNLVIFGGILLLILGPIYIGLELK